MSRRSLFRDVQCRSNFICQSCISAGRKPHQQPWTIRHNSSEATATQRLKSKIKTQGRRRVQPPVSSSSRPKPDTRISLPLGTTRDTENGDAANGDASAALLRDLLKKSDDHTVKFFEKNDKGRVTPLQGDKDFSESLSGFKDFRKDFKLDLGGDMRSLLAELKQDGTLNAIGINDVESVAQDIEANLGNLEDAEAVGEKLDAYIKKLEEQLEAQGEVMDDLQDLNLDEFDLDEDDPEMFLRQQYPKTKKQPRPIPQIPTDTWTYNQRRRVSRLNAILERVDKELRRREALMAKTVQSVWKSYNLSRQTLAKAWGHVPLDVWDLLWKIFSADEAINPNRFPYLSLLARDMSEAKIALNPSQQLISIEAMFVEGFEAKATENWKRCMSTLGDSGSDTFREYWELGVRMFCEAGDLVQAERAVNKLLERHLDPRILMPFIRSCAAQPSEEMREKAWDAYRRLRGMLGESMGLEDYDQVISFFLATNQTERALHAFVDMMTAGTIDLHGRTHLPSKIGNKFFFGKWLKRLIGAGDFDGAHSVFAFMRSKGIEPAPIQINGLIAAWLRSGGAEDLKKGEQVAWDMISARIEFVRARERLAGLTGPVQLVEVNTKQEVGPVPKATLETFCLLAENYRLRRLPKRMEELWAAFREAKISPDAFMLNQLMESHSQFGNIREARALYRSLVREGGVKPDSHTFMALWKMLGANRLNVVGADHVADEVALTRETFAETIRFSHVFDGGKLDGQLARKMLHTLRRLKDDLGIVVALRAFWRLFGYAPPEVLALEMAVGTTNLAWDTASARQKLRLAKRKIDAHVEERQKMLGQPSVTLDEMTPERRGEEMAAYLETLYLSNVPGGEAQLAGVAREMGVYDILVK
ncbi:hypothetical protein SODALDRAFT_298371 [Sodiomyces alkalinus F11]|uniref:Pentatricopeptide repeat protein n=1 Tax=Sodiomyces alkalinus (strain CBS 110278 / VKM F-3762 / F11) TaxID=1314773 RepID=A0A3N2PQN5_SODAK|nr:hypothetical protein SODALDRAFT_298371 [Sodiomyces alkalinus F11]ROT36788.1 hypothetical protein SODALDRAFT_298371 [Sodiomyces alkalinus F11]